MDGNTRDDAVQAWLSWRFRGNYYTHLWTNNGHPEDFGNNLVKQIPENLECQQWIRDRRAWFERRRRTLWKVWRVFKEDIEEASLHFPQSNRRIRAPKRVDLVIHSRCWRITRTPWHTELENEWVYTIDLDNSIFSANNYAHFRLDRIP